MASPSLFFKRKPSQQQQVNQAVARTLSTGARPVYFQKEPGQSKAQINALLASLSGQKLKRVGK